MKIMEKLYKHKYLGAFVISALMLTGFMVSPVCQSNIDESSIVGLIVGALVGVVVAVALLPTIANQSSTLAVNADLDDASQTLVRLWPLFVVIGVFMAIIGMAL
jgi:uncharacterized membrane protein YccC